MAAQFNFREGTLESNFILLKYITFRIFFKVSSLQIIFFIMAETNIQLSSGLSENYESRGRIYKCVDDLELFPK